MAKQCARCPKPALPGARYCLRCRHAREYIPPPSKPRERPPKRRSPLLKRHKNWGRLSARWLAAHPYCARCARTKGVGKQHVIATVVDHIWPVRGYPEKELDEDNLQGLCGPCHSFKTAKERSKIIHDYRKNLVFDLLLTGVDK